MMAEMGFEGRLIWKAALAVETTIRGFGGNGIGGARSGGWWVTVLWYGSLSHIPTDEGASTVETSPIPTY